MFFFSENNGISTIVVDNGSLLSTTIVGLLLFILFVKTRNNDKHLNLQGYSQPPLIKAGYIETLQAISSNKFPSVLLEWSKEAGHIFQFKIPQKIEHPMLVVSGDLELCREVLNDRQSLKPDLYNVYKSIHDGGDDIFASEGAFWKQSRKAMSPAFSLNHIKRMEKTVEEETKKFEKKLDILTQTGESFDVAVEMIHITLSIISKASFEYDLTQEEANTFLTELKIVMREANKGWIPWRWALGVLFPAVRSARKAGRKLLSFGMKILESYRKLESPVKGTVIDLIANNKQYKDDKERASDIVTLFVAGYDTTGFTLAYTLLELAKNPIEQAHLQKSLKSASKKDSSLPELNYVIKESMRLRPVLPLGSPREISRDIIIQKNNKNQLEKDILIPKHSLVICSQILLSRNPNYHKDPEIFLPSRWINPSEDTSASLMPFSLGRRNCIGQSLAKVEIVHVLSRLCAKYNFSVKDEGTVDLFVTHQPVGALLYVSNAITSLDSM